MGHNNEGASGRPSSRLPFRKIVAYAALAGAATVLTAAAYAMFASVSGSVRVAPMAIKVQSASALPAEVQALEAQTAPFLFDRDTGSVHVAYDEQVIELSLDGRRDIQAIKVFGAAPYELSVQAQQGGSWNPIAGLDKLRLANLPAAWSKFTATNAVSTTALRLVITPAAGGGNSNKGQGSASASGLPEIEIWAAGDHALLSGAALVDAWPFPTTPGSTSTSAPTPAQTRAYVAQPASAVVGKDGQTLRFTLDRPAQRFKRAWLSYQAYGVSHWVSPVRRLNGQAVQGGAFTFSGADWTSLSEPIHPQWLQAGDNRIDFALPPNTAGTYSVRNVRVIAELDDGNNFIVRATTGNGSGSEADAPTLTDGSLSTGWSPYADPRAKGGKPELTVYFDKPTQLDSVNLNLVNALSGTLGVDVKVAGEWQNAGLATVNGAKLSAGWNKLTGFAAVPAQAVRISFLNGSGSPAEIREITALGSGVGPAHAPAIHVAYPDAGQFYGRQAYIRGFLGALDNGSGAATLTIAGKTVPSTDGSFGVLVTKEDAGFANQADGEPWQVELTATYPDGQKLTQTVYLSKGYDASKARGVLPNVVAPGFGQVLAGGDATLDIDPDALDKPMDIRITPLADKDLPPLDPGMTNVTPGPKRGYRFTPHGAKFKKDIKVTIPYDPALIPPGHTAEDVKTYYFDTELGRWVELARYKVDSGKRRVTSLTNHFTDMINATLTVPDHPETVSFNATQMKDIKAADPGAGINLIEPPKPNNMGDARLSYPIEIPPGRLGMQPQLAISYNSSGGNGWLGQGWDLSVPSVTVDTRWGVPRYDTANETETYSLNGEMLTPVAHRGTPQARVKEKIFHTRVEGAFSKIIRHGKAPDEYWWEVVDKNGTRYFYGGTPGAGKLSDTVLESTGSGTTNPGVFQWLLRETRDLHGNFVRYHYTRVNDTGVIGGSVAGTNLYVQKITYTGSGTAEGRYSVHFVRDSELKEPRRPDVMIDARGAFKRVTADKLRKIKVAYNGSTVRSYELKYKGGAAFNKTLLEQVIQYGRDGREFNRHRFAYYDEIFDGTKYTPFSSVGWEPGSRGLDGEFVAGTGSFDDQASALSGQKGSGMNTHIAVTVGFNDEELNCKSLTVGEKRGFSRRTSQGVLSLVDIDGDGLPDQVVEGGKYYRNLGNGFKTSPDSIDNRAGGFAGDRARSEDRGIEAVIGCEDYTITAGINTATSKTTTETYFADVNGDGLIDVVKKGQVYFNRRAGDVYNPGAPALMQGSTGTPNPINPGAAAANPTLPAEEVARRLQALTEANPLHDTVRVWEAPFNGTVSVTGSVNLQQIAKSPLDGDKADGVRVAIQVRGAELWSSRIEANDYAEKTPTGVDAIPVKKGDRIYFRVQSVMDGTYDRVTWKPQIKYVAMGDQKDANGKSLSTYSSEVDMLLAAHPGQTVTTPLEGKIAIEGSFTKPVTTDDVRVTIYRNKLPIWDRHFTAGQVANEPLDLRLDVKSGETFRFVVASDTNVDWKALGWQSKMYYVQAANASVNVNDIDGNPQIKLTPAHQLTLYPDRPDIGGIKQDMVPMPWIAPQSGQVKIEPKLLVSGQVIGSAVFSVKRAGALLQKQRLAIDQGRVTPDKQAANIRVEQGDVLWIEYHSTNVGAPWVLSSAATIEYDGSQTGDSPAPPVNVSYYAPRPQPDFGPMYRQWGQFAYNGNGDRASAPLIESELKVEEPKASKTDFSKITDQSELEEKLKSEGYQASKAKFIIMAADFDSGRWIGYDNASWIDATTFSSSRYGEDDIQVEATAYPGPQGGNGYAPSRVSESEDYSFQLGAGGGSGGFSASGGLSKTTGSTQTLTEFMDLNGDRYPDVVSNGEVQYTTMRGGLEGASRGVDNLSDEPRDQKTDANGVTAGAFAKSAKAAGVPKNIHEASMTEPSLGLSGTYGESNDTEKFGWADVNGDGLPDRVYKDGEVSLNLGYAFAAREKWGFGETSKGKGKSSSLSLGFNMGAYSIGGGVAVSRSDNNVEQTLFDVNGDGLPDRVWAGNPVRVQFNNGAGFANEIVDWTGASEITAGSSATESSSGYFTVCIPIYFVKICINPGFGQSKTMSRQEKQLTDIDGDGIADFVQSSEDSQITVAVSNVRRTNLLKQVKRPLGATISIEYEREGNTYAQPHSRWVMSKVTVNDGFAGDGPDVQATAYRYENGYYNRYERDFYGYQKVIEQQIDTAKSESTVYRQVTTTYLNGNYYAKGLEAASLTTDGAGSKYLESRNTWRLRDIATGKDIAADDTQAQNVDQATLFPMLTKSERFFYEGGKGQKSTYTAQSYDSYGNVDHFFDAGEPTAEDDVEAIINYSLHCKDSSYAIGKPTTIDVIGAGKLMRSRTGDVECVRGELKQVSQLIDGSNTATTDLTYYPEGNLETVTGPANYIGKRYKLTYEYDADVKTHVTGVSDSFGYKSGATHDYKFGKPLTSTDLNGNKISYVYDQFGRTESITGPYEQENQRKTLSFAYHPEGPEPHAITDHLNIDAAGKVQNPIQTVLFTDGIKRVIQTKKSASVDGQPVMIVSGRVFFDAYGRTEKQYYPVTERLGQAGKFNATPDGITPTVTTYDVLDRTVKVDLPDDTSTSMEYGFGNDRSGVNQFRTTVTDANLKLKESFRDVRELITSVKEFNAGKTLWTSYAYDPLKQIVEVKDAKGNLTTAEYDQLGRRTVLDNPDTGKTVTVYDNASNVVQKITANLAQAKKAVTYEYDYNRLAEIHYPDNKGNNVTYEYGGPDLQNDLNQIGRLVKVTDASGSEERAYGKLGETVREIRTIASHTQGNSANSPEVYTTQYKYDTFGRLLILTLPDTEVVTYSYDTGGNLQSFAGDKPVQGAGASHKDYLQTLWYDKFEQRSYIKVGNGIETKYAYDPASRRLDNLHSVGAIAGKFQNLNYSYDKVGNILGLANDVAIPAPNSFGGPTSQTFGYDDLYRLTSAKGKFQSSPDKTRRYELGMRYDDIHNIEAKTQLDTLTSAGGNPIVQKPTTYDWAYAYGADKPHAPIHIGGRTYSYDLNGNQTGWTDDKNGTRRVILWDEDNRISEIDDNGHRNKYVYDADGQRVIKTTRQGETVYVNQYYVVRNRSVVSKHLYAGSARIVTELLPGTAPGNSYQGSNSNPSSFGSTTTSSPSTGQGSTTERGHKGNQGNAYAYGHDKQGQGQGNGNGHANGHAKGQGADKPGVRGQQDSATGLPGNSEAGLENALANGQGHKYGIYKRLEREGYSVDPDGNIVVEGSKGGDTGGGDSGTGTASTPPNGQSEFRYYYHPDHLGSTGYVTDANGQLYEHMEYFPFGETWVQEHSNRLRTPYLFTGKELDQETGLYYFGARYYDPRTGVWQSVDPILDRYLTGEPNGGVFTSHNLGLYGYAFLNPIRYTDPDGLSGWDRVLGGLKLAAGVAEASAGAALGLSTGWTGVGAVGGGLVFAHGADVASSGLRQMVSGQPESSLTSKAIQATGVSRPTAETLDASISVLASGGATYFANAPRAAAPAVQEIPNATRAPRQINASWGANTYRHGGLMSGIEHVMYRHGPNSGFANVSRFAAGTRLRDISRYVDEALRHGTVTSNRANAFTVEYNFGRAIGTDAAGNAASSIRVHILDGIIQTAFPI